MKKTIFFFDGDCGLCRSVAYHYKHADGHEKVTFVDITNTRQFNQYRQGLSFEKAKKVIHARLPDGSMKYGADAILTLWKIYPNYKILVTLFDHKLTMPFIHLFYRIIAKNRKHMPSFLLKH